MGLNDDEGPTKDDIQNLALDPSAHLSLLLQLQVMRSAIVWRSRTVPTMR